MLPMGQKGMPPELVAYRESLRSELMALNARGVPVDEADAA